MKTLTGDAHAALAAQAEVIRNTDPQSAATMEVGDEFRQGDLRIVRLPDGFARTHAADLVLADKPDLQLAPGNTLGSRHVLCCTGVVQFYRLKAATPLDGPVVVTGGVSSITHPEHGDVVALPSGCYAFPGQRSFADELRRVVD